MSLLNYYFAPTIIWAYLGVAVIVLLRNSVPPQVIAMVSVFFSLSAGVLAGIGDFAFIKQNKRWFFTNRFTFRLFRGFNLSQAGFDLSQTPVADIIMWIIALVAINNNKFLPDLFDRSSARYEYFFFMLYFFLVPLCTQVIIASVSLSHLLDSLLHNRCDAAESSAQNHCEFDEIDRSVQIAKGKGGIWIAAPIYLLICGFPLVKVAVENCPGSKPLLYVIYVALSFIISFLFHICDSLNVHHALVGSSMGELSASGDFVDKEVLNGYCTLARYNKFGMVFLGAVFFLTVWYVEYWVLTRGI